MDGKIVSASRPPTNDEAQKNRPQVAPPVPAKIAPQPSEHRTHVPPSSPEQNRRLQKQYRDLEESVKRMRKERDAALREKDSVLHENKEVKRKYGHLLTDYQKALNDCGNWRNQHEDRMKQFKALQKEYTNLQKQCSNLERENHLLQNDYARIRSAYDSLAKRCQDLDKDNDLLRSQIATMGTAQEPVHEENFYILKFNQINQDIDSWTAKETRNKPAPLTAETLETLISEVALLGELTPLSVETLKVELLHFHEDRRLRIALIRHIIAVVLFNNVLDRFAFGLNRQSSNYFKFIESQLYSQGISFNYTFNILDIELGKVLMIRQSIGQATLIGQNESSSRRTAIIGNLHALVSILLPATSHDKIQTFITKTVDKAIDLRNAMTGEQAVYSCFFCYRGDSYSEKFVQIASGEKPTGNVLFCTFPGLNRLTIREDMKKEFLNVIKASVKLEGVFGTRPVIKDVPAINMESVNKGGHGDSVVTITGAEAPVSSDPSLAPRESVVSVESTASVESRKDEAGVKAEGSKA